MQSNADNVIVVRANLLQTVATLITDALKL
jgi:hypothetical protein